MLGVIRLNDPLENGGQVISASGSTFMDIPVALKGDTVFCELHQGTYPIVGCHDSWTMNDRGVAVDGCKAACGCAMRTTLTIAGVA